MYAFYYWLYFIPNNLIRNTEKMFDIIIFIKYACMLKAAQTDKI